MYCIGSGIAAFYPIIQSIVNNDLEETRIKLFAGFRSVCQIPLKQRLQLLADYWNVEFTIHVTEVEEITTIHNIQIKKEKINENNYKAVLQKESSESTLVLICGNEEFNEALSQWTQECNHINYYVFK
ncbi:NADH-cytochrome b5 reductase-like [Chelonus insularis]|nr:NADH-cytochrome b5 reductase-like [Chelonus insularis]